MQYVPPSPPKSPMPRPVVLTDEKVREIFAREPIRMNDGAFPVFGRVIGWQRLDSGVLGAIVVNPETDKRVLYGIDYSTGKPRSFGAPKPRKY